MHNKEMELEDLGLICEAQDREQWRVLMNLWVP
jgi:hypothetical protein